MVAELGLTYRTLDPWSVLFTLPSFVKSRTPDIWYTLHEGKRMRLGRLLWVKWEVFAQTLSCSLPIWSKRLYFVTVEDNVPGNRPQGPGIISSFRGLAGISCYVIWVLQIATIKLRLSLLSLPLRRNVYSWVTSCLCPAALWRLGLAPRMFTGSQHEGLCWEQRAGQPRGQWNISSRQLALGQL